MKITLISTSTYPSDQGIRTISSCLKKAGHQVQLVFLTASEDYSKFYPKKVLEQLKEMCSDSKLIGFSSMASTAKKAEQAIAYLKLLNIPIGLLINFHEAKLTDGISRLILPGAGQ